MSENDQNGTDGTAQRARSAFQEHVMDPARRAGETMQASGRKMAENSSTIGVAIIDQAQSNAQEAFAAMRAAAQAKDLSEVMQIQGDFLRAQGKRSMDQAREIGELIMRFGRDAVTPSKAE
ncbi:phasin family protein [Sphingomonas adhaesiva]|uniref:phasin family protein n=1 Tax=Sphingomonas adhaesiva TaxID=28212 RepID=UPI002FF81425